MHRATPSSPSRITPGDPAYREWLRRVTRLLHGFRDPDGAKAAARLRSPFIGGSYTLAAFLLLVPFLAAFLTAVGFTVGIVVSHFHLPVILALAALATWAVARAEGISRRDAVRAVGTGAVILVAAALAGHLLLDFSYDGQAYHQSGIRQLVAGWNPARRALGPPETTHGLWLNHYVRASELGAAIVTAATGSLEAGKALGIALVVPAAILCALALQCSGLRRGPSIIAASLAVANPIVISQLPTFYVDGQLALAFACVLALGWLALRRCTRTAPLLFAMAVALLANVKFTSTVYALLLVIGYVAAALLRRERPLIVWAPAVLAAALTLATGWQPLVTNAVRHGHPFHPVAGPSRVDGRAGQTPYFRHADPLRRLIESTISESNAARAVPIPKLPFAVRHSEVAAMAHPDVRLGGFGPLFALACLSVILGIAALMGSGIPVGSRAGLGIAACVLATALVNPGAWWARFVPQIWLAVVLASIAVAAGRKAARIFGTLAMAALTANAVIVGVSTFQHQAETHASASRQARELSRDSLEIELPRGEMESLDARLDRLGLRARYVAGCTSTLPLVGAYADYCVRGATASASSAGASQTGR